jgi:hypothetical protein
LRFTVRNGSQRPSSRRRPVRRPFGNEDLLIRLQIAVIHCQGIKKRAAGERRIKSVGEAAGERQERQNGAEDRRTARRCPATVSRTGRCVWSTPRAPGCGMETTDVLYWPATPLRPAGRALLAGAPGLKQRSVVWLIPRPTRKAQAHTFCPGSPSWIAPSTEDGSCLENRVDERRER